MTEVLIEQLHQAGDSIAKVLNRRKHPEDFIGAIRALGVALRHINDLDSNPLINERKRLAVRSIADALQSGSEDMVFI